MKTSSSPNVLSLGAAQNNLNFNNLQVIPEPSVAVALTGLCALGFVLLRGRNAARGVS